MKPKKNNCNGTRGIADGTNITHETPEWRSVLVYFFDVSSPFCGFAAAVRVWLGFPAPLDEIVFFPPSSVPRPSFCCHLCVCFCLPSSSWFTVTGLAASLTRPPVAAVNGNRNGERAIESESGPALSKKNRWVLLFAPRRCRTGGPEPENARCSISTGTETIPHTPSTSSSSAIDLSLLLDSLRIEIRYRHSCSFKCWFVPVPSITHSFILFLLYLFRLIADPPSSNVALHLLPHPHLHIHPTIQNSPEPHQNTSTLPIGLELSNQQPHNLSIVTFLSDYSFTWNCMEDRLSMKFSFVGFSVWCVIRFFLLPSPPLSLSLSFETK